MASFPECMHEYKKQLERGMIQQAYKGLMDYMLALRAHFKNGHADYAVPGSLYFGYMDMTYFSCVPKSLKQRDLKIAVVFLHEACRFEVWLAGYNKQVQEKYWKLFKDSGWDRYRLVPTTQGADSILEHVIADDPDFKDLEALTAQIEAGILKFADDVERFLLQHAN